MFRALTMFRAMYARKSEDTDVPRAKIVPCFPSGTLKLRRTTVDGDRASLASPVLQTRTTGSWSWLRFACSVPHSPSLDPFKEEGVAGTIARYRSLTGLMPLSMHKPCGGTAVSSVPYSAKGCPAHQPPPRNLRGNGFPNHAEPTNNIKPTARGQVFLGKIRANRRFTTRASLLACHSGRRDFPNPRHGASRLLHSSCCYPLRSLPNRRPLKQTSPASTPCSTTSAVFAPPPPSLSRPTARLSPMPSMVQTAQNST